MILPTATVVGPWPGCRGIQVDRESYMSVFIFDKGVELYVHLSGSELPLNSLQFHESVDLYVKDCEWLITRAKT